MRLGAELEPTDLATLVAQLRGADALQLKRDIQLAAQYFPLESRRPTDGVAAPIINGDDAAAIADAEGYLLVAAEGMQASFVQRDPWFAGYCSVMVNVSDIVAMGGRPLAVVDVLFSGGDTDNHRLLAGMRDASEAFGVPIVGGHTGRAKQASALAVAIVGRARRLISSFAASPGQELVFAVDLRGTYRGRLNFNGATHKSSAQLQALTGILPEAAERGLVAAGKDVSMAGLLGTLAMLCEASRCGARVELSDVPRPDGVDELRWLLSFPSFGYLLAVDSNHVAELRHAFELHGIACAAVGRLTRESGITLTRGEQQARYWSLDEGLTGYAPSPGVRPEAPITPLAPRCEAGTHPAPREHG